MNKSIRFCYRKIIDNNSTKAWERLVFEDSYAEFKMQGQRFNIAGVNSFGEMLQKNTAAEQLHFLVSGAALGYVQQLNGKIPDVVNSLGRQFLPFINFRFEIINSDIKDVSKHTVAINFFSEPVNWIDSIGDTMLLNINNEKENNELLTHMLTLQPYLSICSIQ
jgi:hypothetical protein